ncbi:MAG TPA: DUF2147 domain-containing protein [Caldimonas sp.]|jgi:uncharacterized protein (DUF2147 family)|nr:DUF2147 domain-containing protein [Caldimonas sp.]
MTTTPARAAAIVCLLAAACAPAWAQSTPAGVWKTIDDATGKEKSLVRIVETNGAYTGKIEKLLDPDSPKDATCKECKDDRKDKPVVGMTIIRNVKANDDKTAYEGGDILDPNNGKVYRVRLRPFDDGKKLEVRGYLGPFYRNQTWLRVE